MRGLLLLLLPALVLAQNFEFQQELDTIPVEISNWQIFQPWAGGLTESNPAIVDIDADGDLDFLIGRYLGYISFFRNDGTTLLPNFTFITAKFDYVYVSEHRNKPCFRDLDNDGDLDIVISDTDSNMHLFRNIGTPQEPDFFHEDSSLVTVPPWCMSPELVDIDADGDYDLFGGNYGEISFFINVGSPDSFNFILDTAAFEGIDVGDKASPDFVDIDVDGDLDLFVGNEVGNIWFYLNEGDSINYNFVYQTNYFANIDAGDIASPEFADIDGDEDYDLFVGSEEKGLFFYENRGTPQIPYFRPITDNYLTMDLGSGKPTPQLVDINGDDVLDLFADASTILDYFENIGSVEDPSFLFAEEGWQGIAHSAIQPYFVDIDADGDYDLFCGENAVPSIPSIALYINIGTPGNPQMTLYDPEYITNDDFFAIVLPVLADIDADNDYDLFITDNHGHFFYYENMGDSSMPNFTLVDTLWQGIQFEYPHNGHKGFTFGDLDDDEDLDMLLQSPVQNNLYFYRNIGTPQVPIMYLETEEFLDYAIDFIYRPHLADIDTDSDLDLFIGDEAGGIVFFRNVTGQNEVGPRRPDIPYPKLDFIIGPNPANPVTWISFSLPAPQEATLAVYNILGAKVTTLASGIQMPGTHNYIWNASQYSSGVYIIRLETPQFTSSQRVMVVK